MDDSFTRPYVDETGRVSRLVHLTDAQFTEAAKHGRIRRLRPGEELLTEIVSPTVEPVTQVVSAPATRQAADTVLGDTVAHPVPEVRERDVP